mmetsp:Transcript_18829/g.20737  ORF Transcript_18829/g.20737 Transcript_18829/m.20737 type:complete len:86 (-) Transcript_18829:254-511(-)
MSFILFIMYRREEGDRLQKTIYDLLFLYSYYSFIHSMMYISHTPPLSNDGLVGFVSVEDDTGTSTASDVALLLPPPKVSIVFNTF